MTSINRKNWTGVLTSLLLAGFTGMIMTFLLERTEFQAGRGSLPVMCWLFPVSVFLFDVLSRFVASPGRRRKAEWITQWMSLGVLPFLLLGMTWSYFESWRFIFSAFFWLYVVSRTGCILFFRQPPVESRPLDQKDALLLMTAVTILNIWSAQPNAFFDVVQAVANGTATGLIALLVSLVAQTICQTGFAGSAWQRGFALLVAISVPMLAVNPHVSFFHLLSMSLLSFLYYSSGKDKRSIRITLFSGGFFLLVTPIVFPAGAVASLWLCITILAWHRQNRYVEGILVPGGAVVLFLAGFLVAGLRCKGIFPPGLLVYPLPTGVNWLSPLLDRSGGLLPQAPWALLCFTGWLLAGRKQALFGTLKWLGFPIVLTGTTALAWSASGSAPDWQQWLLIMPLLYPYFSVLWSSNRFSELRASLVRVIMCAGFAFSAGLYLGKSVSLSDTVSPDSLLNDFATRTGIELFSLFPAISHNLPGSPVSVGIWLVSVLLIIFAIALSGRIQSKSQPVNRSGILDLIFLTVFICMIGLSLKYTQIWHALPMKNEMQIAPGKNWRIETGVDNRLLAIKLLTNLSRSTHVAQGQAVADVILELRTGEVVHKELQAGIHTAEWAYTRPDVLRIIQHQQPPRANSWQVEQPDGSVFSGFNYEGLIFLDEPAAIRSIEIVNIDPDENGTLVTIKAVGLMLQTNNNRWRSPIRLLQEKPILLDKNNPVHKIWLSGETSFRKIYLDSALGNAAAVKDGTVVGQISLKSREGLEKLWKVRAGFDTAEWSILRPDMIGRVMHGTPKIAVSERRMHFSLPYLANIYRSEWLWDPAISITSVTFEYLGGEERDSGGEWMIRGVVLR